MAAHATPMARWLMEPAAKAVSLAELTARVPALAGDARWTNGLPGFVFSQACQVVTWPAGDAPAQAIGLVTIGEQPLAESALLLVEALWVADDRPEIACAWAAAVMAKADAMDVEGVILPPDTPVSRALVDAGAVAGHPVLLEPVPLRYAVAGLFSAFTDGPTTTALVTPRCTFVCNRRRLAALAGVPDEESALFYRGEGRLCVPPWWDCADLPALAAFFRASGFPTRAATPFDGGVQAQLLQQGYVNQGTASMSRAFEVSAWYATQGGTQPGVVFCIDAAALRSQGPVFDAWRTLLAHSEALMDAGDMATFAAIVRTLGPLAAGRCLAHWDAVAQRTARRRGGMLRRGDAFDAGDYVEPALARQLHAGGIDSAATGRLLQALETHAMHSVTPFAMARAVEVMADGRTRDVPMRHGYAVAFGLALPALREALAGQQAEHRQPGWDLTVFGYIAKTCRDQEVFSTGPIPAAAVVEAVIVRADGARA